MPALFRGRLRGLREARPENRGVPHVATQGGVMQHTAMEKPDPAHLAGSGGAPSAEVRAAGTSPSIRGGLSRGVRLAGLGVGVGAAFGIPRALDNVLGSGRSGGLDDLIFGTPRDSKSSSENERANPASPSSIFSNIGPTLILTAIIAGGAYVLGRR